MKVTMLLADAAQSVDGKLYILGGGWSLTGPTPTPSAVALKLEVPWDQANTKHTFDLSLLDADGNPVVVPTPQGEQAIQLGGEFEVGRPAGLIPGTPIDITMAISLGPLPLPAGSRFTWRLTIDNTAEDDWYVSFSTRPAVP
jgi:Family of unknown function (DUF6941)